MAENKTYTLTEKDLDGIISAAVKAVSVSQNKEQPKQNVNDIALANQADQARLQASLRFNKELVKSELIPINLPVSLSDYFGDSVTISVNGNTIKVPVDGMTYYISKPHYQQLQKKIMHNNVQLSRNKKTRNNSVFGTIQGDIGMVIR